MLNFVCEVSVEDLTNVAERMGQADTSAEARCSVSPAAQDKMAVRAVSSDWTGGSAHNRRGWLLKAAHPCLC